MHSIAEASALPLVSILIYTHNRPDYVEIALKSAIAQSYGNIEIVISDNGDDTASQERLAPYLASHPNIRYYRKQGMSAFENAHKCLELSSGDYVNFLMDDDVFHPDKISRMMGYYLQNPTIGLVTSYRELIDGQGNPLAPIPGTERLFPADTLIGGQSLGKLMLGNGSNLVGEPTTVLVRRADISPVFGMFAGKRYTVLGDVAAWLSILATRDCVYISEPLSYFRIHGGQDQRSGRIKVDASLEWFSLFIDAYEKNLFPRERAEYLDLLAGKIGGFASHIAMNHADIRNNGYDHARIVDTLRDGYARLLEIKPAG